MLPYMRLYDHIYHLPKLALMADWFYVLCYKVKILFAIISDSEILFETGLMVMAHS